MKRAIYETAAHRTVLTIGNFDGVHRGHVEVLRTARALADRETARLVAVTFTKTPKAALTPEAYAGDLLTLADKEKYLRLQGVDEIIWLQPTVAQMRQSATEFLHMLQNNRHVVGVVVGENFRFGADAQGTVTTLQNYAKDAGWEVISVP
ncbi:adenylyltransferase/cytidyltransferase family protein, partial [Negativicoccus succinicivorans]